MKICKQCNKNKNLSEYYKTPNTIDGHLGKCKKCITLHKKAWAINNKTTNKKDKKCKKCLIVKKIYDYYSNFYNKDGKQSICKKCSLQYDVKYYKSNYATILAKSSKYRATKLNQTPNMSQEELDQIKKLYIEAKELELKDGIKRHVDHIIPISKGGLHHPNNLQILTAKENLKKGAKIQTD